MQASDLSRIQNKAAYIIGLLKTNKKKCGVTPTAAPTIACPYKIYYEGVPRDKGPEENAVRVSVINVTPMYNNCVLFRMRLYIIHT